MLLFFFFSLAQAAVLVYLRKHPNFSECKWTFLLLETIIIFSTISWYLLTKKTQTQPAQKVKKPLPVKQEPTEQPTRNTEEIASLKEALSHLTQVEASSKKRIEELEQEKDSLKEKLLLEETLRAEAVANIEQYGPLVFTLSLEMEKLSSHIEEIKRHHDIEIRALLGREEKNGIKKTKIPSKTTSFRPATSPLASTLLLLIQCHKGLSLQNTAWPAQEHSLLVRRKFFDLVSSYSSTPFAIVSLTSPSDYFLSPKLPEECSILTINSLIAPHTKTLSSLRPFEPYFISDKRFPCVSFRIAWDNLDDLLAIVPTEPANSRSLN
jgi:hypothetical protein